MSINAVVDLSHELRRLALAGSDLAIGDARLSAIVPVLHSSGTTIPVFAKIAEKTSALLVSDRVSAPGLLLQLNVLIVAVLKTQGKAGIEGDLAVLAPMAMTCRNLSMQVFDQIGEAVETGDYYFIQEVLKDGFFNDARLLPLAIAASRSSYDKLASYAVNTLLPTYGKSIVPFLIAQLDLGLKEPAKRLIRYVATADAKAGAVLARQILDPESESVYKLPSHAAPISDEAMIAALGILTCSKSDRALLTDALGSKKKAIRVAAMQRLLIHGDDAMSEQCITMLGSSTTKAREALESIKTITSPKMRNAVRALVPVRLESVFSDAIKAADMAVLTSSLYLLFDEDAQPDSDDVSLALRALQACHEAWKSSDNSSKKGLFWGEIKRWEEIHIWGKVGTGPLRRIISYLLLHSQASEYQAFAPLAFSVSPGLSIIAAIECLGPKITWDLLAHSSGLERKNYIAVALKGFRPSRHNDVTEVWPSCHDSLPEADQWNIEWFVASIENSNSVLHDHLLEHFIESAPDQTRKLLFDAVSSWDFEWALLALWSDPDCAMQLLKKLTQEHDDYELFDSLFNAIADNDAEEAFSKLDSLSEDDYCTMRVEALRKKLTEHFA